MAAGRLQSRVHSTTPQQLPVGRSPSLGRLPTQLVSLSLLSIYAWAIALSYSPLVSAANAASRSATTGSPRPRLAPPLPLTPSASTNAAPTFSPTTGNASTLPIAQLLSPPIGSPPTAATPTPTATPSPNPALANPGSPNPVVPSPGLDDKFDRYRLGPADQVLITVQRFPDLTFQGPINPEGAIVLPIAGTIRLQGLTLAEAQARVKDILNRYFVNPDVSLVLISQRPVQVTVVGEVQRPGFFPLSAPKVSVALVAAGGTKSTADLRIVTVRRSLLNGSVIEQKVDLYSPLNQGGSLPDLRLEDGDAVVVPKLAQLADPSYDRGLVARSTLATPNIRIRVLNYAGGGGPGGGAGTINTLSLPSNSTFRDVMNGISLSAANLDGIALVRFDPETKRAVTQRVNGRKLMLGDPSQPDLALQDNDVVIVGRNFVTRISYFLNTFTQPFRDILGFLLFFDSLSTSANNLFRPTGTP